MNSPLPELKKSFVKDLIYNNRAHVEDIFIKHYGVKKGSKFLEFLTDNELENRRLHSKLKADINKYKEIVKSREIAK